MKKLLLFAAIITLTFFACKKNDNKVDPNPPANEESNTVFYVDTFRIYSTDLNGNNRKLVVDENLGSGNNYIGSVTYLPVAKKLVYSYIQIYTQPMVIKSCNLDGSDKKILKTIPASTSVAMLKGTSDGQIIFQTNTFNQATVVTNTYTMKADGTGETQIINTLYIPYLKQAQISTEGKGILNSDGYFSKLKNGVFAESESFNLFLNEDNAKITSPIISADATKAAFVLSTATSRKYEVRIKDVIKNSPTSKVLYTVNIAADASDQAPYIKFVNGNKYIMVYYGKFTSPKGSPADYTQCELINVSTGTAINWKFMGDDVYEAFAN